MSSETKPDVLALPAVPLLRSIFITVFLLSVFLGLSPALMVVVAGLVGLGLKRVRGWNS